MKAPVDPSPPESPLAADPGQAVAPVSEGSPASGAGPNTVTVVRRARDTGETRTFHILGTAHVSRSSVDEVRATILALRPDTVCVELCPTRHAALTDPQRWRGLDVAGLVREGRAGFTLATLALQAFQKRMGDRLGVRPGAELLEAVVTAREVGATLVLADREVQITLRRAWGNLGPIKRAMLVAGLFASAFAGDEIDEADVEALKQRSHVSDVMSQLGRSMPEIKGPLIDERDRYLVSHLEAAPGAIVLAVVGAGHVEGMLANLGKPVARAELETLPVPTALGRAAAWLGPLAVVVAVAAGVVRGAPPWELARAWMLPTALTTGLGVALARARLLTVLAAAILGPAVAWVPGAPGRVLGGLEVAARGPTAADGARLGEELGTVRGALRNPVARSLLVASVAGFGAAVGRWFGLGWLGWLAFRGG